MGNLFSTKLLFPLGLTMLGRRIQQEIIVTAILVAIHPKKPRGKPALIGSLQEKHAWELFLGHVPHTGGCVTAEKRGAMHATGFVDRSWKKQIMLLAPTLRVIIAIITLA